MAGHLSHAGAPEWKFNAVWAVAYCNNMRHKYHNNISPITPNMIGGVCCLQGRMAFEGKAVSE